MRMFAPVLALCLAQDPAKQEYKAPDTKPGAKEGWEDYVEPPMYDAEKVKDLAPGLDSPEAAVVHFYASRIRGDEKWKEALPPREKWDKSLERKLAKMEKWVFKKMQLVGRKKVGEDEWYVKIYMEVEIEGKKDSGKDTATVRRIEGKWYVARPPT
ncbi:MAG: hypothetical protein HYY17_15675 [Planctomycetes bacterium]|nr:hypothetical protein [Planctomycetota bacterium]